MGEIIMAEQELEYPEIQQDHKRGPGWFLTLSYIIIAIFCVYYFFAYKDWKSSYVKQQEAIQIEATQ
jgi:hypothetical protein